MQVSHDDIPVLSKVKQQVNKVVERELAKQDFKDQLSQEALANTTYEEVITRKNFFF
jgi:hypothetical protein